MSADVSPRDEVLARLAALRAQLAQAVVLLDALRDAMRKEMGA